MFTAVSCMHSRCVVYLSCCYSSDQLQHTWGIPDGPCALCIGGWVRLSVISVTLNLQMTLPCQLPSPMSQRKKLRPWSSSMFRVAALAWEPMSSSLRSLHHIASLEKSSSITEGGHWGLESVSREWQLQGLSVFLRLV